MAVRCDETRKAIRRLARNRRIVAFFTNADDSTPIARFEVREPYSTVPDAEGRVRLVEHDWQEGLPDIRKREIQRLLGLDDPLYPGTEITLVGRLQREGKLRVISQAA